MDDFIQERLNLGYDFGTLGGFSYSTTIIQTGGGAEQRNSNWGDGLGKWQIGERLYSRDELEYLTSFFRITRGAAKSFLFRDWSDYQVKDELLSSENDLSFPIFKTYSIGSSSTRRRILYPDTGSVRVKVGGVPRLSGFIVEGGVLTFPSPVEGVQVTCDFDLKVRFGADSFENRYDGGTGEDSMFFVSTLSVVEVRN